MGVVACHLQGTGGQPNMSSARPGLHWPTSSLASFPLSSPLASFPFHAWWGAIMSPAHWLLRGLQDHTLGLMPSLLAGHMSLPLILHLWCFCYRQEWALGANERGNPAVTPGWAS